MIVQLTDRVAGTSIYINPTYIMTLRPDPTDPDHLSLVKLRDGETIQLIGSHEDVAEKLAVPTY